MDKVKNNLVFRSKWAEMNGAMGDLGTCIPIVLALTLAKDLNLGTTLIFTGVYNIVTGAIYGVPVPVRPMKSIAAVAILDGSDLDILEMMAAGICTGGILLVLGVTGLMQIAYKLIPLPVVRGIQVPQGLSFAMSAVKYIRTFQEFSKSKTKGCVAIFGAGKMVLRLVLGSSLVMVLDQFPVGVLGVLLLFAGVELAMACRDMHSKEEHFVMLTCTAVSLVVSGAALGFMYRGAFASQNHKLHKRLGFYFYTIYA